MNTSGDAAEQVVRLSLEGFEVAAKLTGAAAKNVAVLLMATLKQEGKTKGKARLTNMIRSGKELKVFSIPQKDLKKFTEHARTYGVLYCVLRDKYSKNENTPIDIIARADDASKIQRIIDRFEIGKVDKASIIVDAQKDIADRESVAAENVDKTHGEQIVDGAIGKAGGEHRNPSTARTDKDPPSRQNSDRTDSSVDRGNAGSSRRPSVKEKLDRYVKEARQWEKSARWEPEKTGPELVSRYQIRKKNKMKER